MLQLARRVARRVSDRWRDVEALLALSIARGFGEEVLREMQRSKRGEDDDERFAYASPEVEPGDAAAASLPDCGRKLSFVPDEDPDLDSFLERRRAEFVAEQVRPALFAALAKAWKKGNLNATNLSMLPMAEPDGHGGEWRFAGAMMHNNLLMVGFVLIYALGVSPEDANAIGKRILNEWHGLEPDAFLTPDERKLLGLPELEENRA